MRRTIYTNIDDIDKYDALMSVMYHLNEGLWKSNRLAYSHYINADIVYNRGYITFYINDDQMNEGIPNPYYHSSDEQVLKYFANKLKSIINTEKKNSDDPSNYSWNSNNEYYSKLTESTISTVYNTCKQLLES